MFTLSKRMTVEAAHTLKLNYPSKCTKLHGHRYHIMVDITSDDLNEHGMVCDFNVISDVVSRFDHAVVEDVIKCNSTAEAMAQWIGVELNARFARHPGNYGKNATVDRVVVEETEGNAVCYIP
jgi:6-pyruvoyltetrahydropterin/6-carboxytetrahydropterin synthase